MPPLNEPEPEVVQSRETVGLHAFCPRNPAHKPIDWFETDYDDDFSDPDGPEYDPFPTARHREIP